MSRISLQNQTILVTGASSGLGRGMAVALANGGNRIILTSRREALLEEVAAEVRAQGSECLVAPADVTDADACAAMIEAGIDAFGPIDVAILNAGGGRPLDMNAASVDDVLSLMRLNYDGLVHCLVPMMAQMRERGGAIAYTGSPAGYFGLPNAGPYCAAKAAGRVLFDACRVELADTPIQFVALYPGFTLTPGIDPDVVPHKALMIDIDRAVHEMLGAIERGDEHHMFPKRIKGLMGFGRALSEPMRRWILKKAR